MSKIQILVIALTYLLIFVNCNDIGSGVKSLPQSKKKATSQPPEYQQSTNSSANANTNDGGVEKNQNTNNKTSQTTDNTKTQTTETTQTTQTTTEEPVNDYTTQQTVQHPHVKYCQNEIDFNCWETEENGGNYRRDESGPVYNTGAEDSSTWSDLYIRVFSSLRGEDFVLLEGGGFDPKSMGCEKETIAHCCIDPAWICGKGLQCKENAFDTQNSLCLVYGCVYNPNVSWKSEKLDNEQNPMNRCREVE